MASYVVAASVFIIGSSYLLHFVVEPPGGGTAGIEHQALRVNAQTALEVLLGTPGYPSTWDSDVTAIQRLGLIEKGTTIRIDPDKFDALARGKLATASADGYIDYAEAKDALGIDGYEFHLRAYPVTAANESVAYGLEGMTDFRIAYVGDWNSGGVEQGPSKEERGALDALNVGFTNTTREAGPTGDVYEDNSADLRTYLLPVIGPTIQQTVLSAGAGTKYDFYRVNATTYDPLVDKNFDLIEDPNAPDLTSALALSSDGATLGYTKNRELRAIVGGFNVSGNAGSIEWREYVDTGFNNNTYDCGDYGFVEISYDDGSTWTRLTDTAALRSKDCDTPSSYKHGTQMEPREATFASCACTRALLAFHWVGDNDNNAGYGWIIDDVVVTSGGTALSETFTAPEYDMLIIGSDVDHGAFTPDDIKNGIRDYVDLYGGRLVVLGGQNNVQWLDRLFDAGTGGSSGGVATPDTTHPLLTLPNQLSYTGYSSAADWNFTEEESTLFSMIMGDSAVRQELSVSRPGAWTDGGSADGAVILTSYKPYNWSDEETRMFFANAAIYGKFHYLYLEVGPEVPDGEAVASVARSATMNKYRTGEANYTEMAFVLYLWPGSSSEDTQAAAAITPTAPRSLSVTSTSGRAELTWRYPVSNGTTNITHFEVWRGHSETTITGQPIAKIARNAEPTTQWTYFYNDTTVVDGTTYYYNITAARYTDAGATTFHSRGTPSAVNSTTPLSLPTAPASPDAASGAGFVTVTWTSPETAATGTILGYRISAATDGVTYGVVGEIGSATTFTHVPGDSTARTYKIEALNAVGYGPASAATDAQAPGASTPITAPTVVVSPALEAINLSWVEPGDLLGQTIQGWRIWRSIAEAGTYTELVYLGALNSSFQDAGLTIGTTYWYKVQGITDVGAGANSTADSGTALGVPTAPLLFAGSNATVGSIALSWTAPLDLGSGAITNYRLWASTDGTTWAILDTIGTNTSFIDANIGTNNTRQYRVQAITTLETTTVNGTNASVTAKAKGVPYPPTAVSATTLLGTTTIAWLVPYSDDTVTSYEIWMADTETGTYALHGTDTLTPYTIAGGAGSGKWFKLKAISAVGTGTFSAADQG